KRLTIPYSPIDVVVISGVAARQGFDGSCNVETAYLRINPSPPFTGFLTPSGGAGNDSVLQRVFLRVESMLCKGPVNTKGYIAWSRVPYQIARLNYSCVVGIFHSDVVVVGGRASLALNPYRGRQRLRIAKENEHLIDHMGTKVVKDSGAGGLPFLPGTVIHLRPVAVIVRLKLDKRSQYAGLQDLLHRHEIAVPSSVLEHGQQFPMVACLLAQRVTLTAVDYKRLLDDSVFAGFEYFQS